MRGAIDFLHLLRGLDGAALEPFLAAGCAAYGSKVQVKPSVRRRPAEIIREIMLGALPAGGVEHLLELWRKSGDTFLPDSAGGALVEAGGGRAPDAARGGAVRGEADIPPPRIELAWEGQGAGGVRGASDRRPTEQPLLDLQFRFTYEVQRLTRYRPEPWVTPAEAKRWATLALRPLSGEVDPDGAPGSGALRAAPWPVAGGGELDLDATLDGLARTPFGPAADDLRLRARAQTRHRFLILIDHSGSMVGRKLAVSAVLAAVLARWAAGGRCEYAVCAFDQEVSALKGLAEDRDPDALLHEILHLPEGRSTDLGLALRAAAAVADDSPEPVTVILVSDCMPTRGVKTFGGLRRLAEAIPSLFICHVGDAADDLYGWWALRWVGPDRLVEVTRLDDIVSVVDRLTGPRATAVV